MQEPYNPEQLQQNYYPPTNYIGEEEIKNIVGQIDPKHILDNLNHALKGEYFNKEKGCWEKIGENLVNDFCRGWIISYFTSFMNNASTMGIISEQQFSYLMEGIIKNVTKEFRCNLERFGFVEKGYGFEEGRYENKGSPDTSRMDYVSEMIYRAAALVLSRSLSGTENKRMWKSLTMSDTGGYGDNEMPRKKGWISRLAGK